MSQQSKNNNSFNENQQQQLNITDNNKKEFSLAFNECWDRLKLNNYYVFDCDETPTLTWRSAVVSQDMYNFMVTIFENMSKYVVDNTDDATDNNINNINIICNDNTIVNNQDNITNQEKAICSEDNISSNEIIIFDDEPYDEVVINRVDDTIDDKSSSSSSSSSSLLIPLVDTIPNEIDCNKSLSSNKINNNNNNIKSSKLNKNIQSTSPYNPFYKKTQISLDEKIKVLNLVSENPYWTLDEIRKNTGYHQIFSFNQLSEWLEHVKNGGTIRDMMNKLYESVYEKFIDYKKKFPNKKISNEMLRQWGLEIKKIYTLNGSIGNVKFEASKGWIKKFKLRYNIVGHKSDLEIGHQKRSQRLKKDNDATVDVAVSGDDADDGGGVGVSVGDDDDDQQNFSVSVVNVGRQSASTKKHRKMFENNEIIGNKKRERTLTLQEKQRVVRMAKDHPSWSFGMLKKMSGSKHLRSIESLRRWEIQLEQGGSIFDKKVELRRWVLEKFINYKKNNIKITDNMIENWSIEGQKKFRLPNKYFCSTTWIRSFKIKHHIFGNEFDLQIKNISLNN